MFKKLLFVAVVLLGLSGCAGQLAREEAGTRQFQMNAVNHTAATWDNIEQKRRACIDYNIEASDVCLAKEFAAKRDFCATGPTGYEGLCQQYRYGSSAYGTSGVEHRVSYEDRRYYGRRTGTNNPPAMPKTPLNAERERMARQMARYDAVCENDRSRLLQPSKCPLKHKLLYRTSGGRASDYIR